MVIDGKAFDPHLYFRAWQSDDDAHRAGKNNHRTRVRAALVDQIGSTWSGKAEHLNALCLLTHAGKLWTADNLRKRIAATQVSRS